VGKLCIGLGKDKTVKASGVELEMEFWRGIIANGGSTALTVNTIRFSMKRNRKLNTFQ
jgi:hypothetical protein